MGNQAIFLMGPTASGKTEIAIQMAQVLPIDIISVDSAMVYRGMDIGTGKPNLSQQRFAPHKLIDICDPHEPYSVAQFCSDAKREMQNTWLNNRIPLLVGGTMLYFKALQFGLAQLPAADPVLREQLELQARQIGWPAMHASLALLDPVSAKRLTVNDSQRIARALEINILTGSTLSEHFAQQEKKILDYKINSFALIPDRALLHEKIKSRFMSMLEMGLVEEVERLRNRGDLTSALPAIKSVGYKQVWAYLEQNTDYITMRDQAIAATRQLAKRQYTWLRTWPEVIRIANYDSSERVLDTIVNFVLDSGKH